VWPLRQVIDGKLWLENFLDVEMEHAVHLLNAFLYFPEPFVSEMFKAAFQGLSQIVVPNHESFLAVQTEWREFVDKVVITNVTGESPNISDSGVSFTRRAKQLLGISESRTLTNEETIRDLLDNGPRPVVFVDDFVGSGNQFIETWKRSIRLSSSLNMSFEKLATIRGSLFFYTPLLCTEYGLDRIAGECQGVVVKPAHIISKRYSAFAPDSLIWPAHLQPTATEFIKHASERAGIIRDGAPPEAWQGFHRLGLAVAFHDSIPDATLPIFSWEHNGWKPLIKIRSK
jgi:hypothetical protein